jgi:hypothetical protein
MPLVPGLFPNGLGTLFSESRLGDRQPARKPKPWTAFPKKEKRAQV